MANELNELLAFESSAVDLSELAGVTVARELLRRDVPPRLGRWQVQSSLGQGGMGSVYRVTREDLGIVHTGAAKRGHHQIQSAAALAAIQREAGALSSLQHGGIARLLDFGSDEHGMPFVVSEYIDGVPLLEYLQAQRPDRGGRLRLFLQLLDAVVAAHANLVLHLDIKPDNVLVTDSGQIKLIDFGLSGLGGEKPAGYTQAYASPEQLAGQPVTVAADIYSLGKVLQQVVSCPPALEDFETMAVIETATAREPGDRYASALALKLDIEALLQRRPVGPLQHRRFYRWSRFLRRQWFPTALTLLTLATLITALLSVYRQNVAVEIERDRALDLLASERATSSFVTESLREASVFAGGDGEMTVAELMHSMLKTLHQEEKMSPRSKSWLASDLAAVFTGLGQMDAALAASEMAVASAGLSDEIEDDIAHWTQLALTAGVAHRYELALEAAQNARDIALPVNHWRLPWTYLATMQTLMAMKRWPDVVDLYSVIERLPTERRSVTGNIHYMRGTALANMERFAEAEADFRVATEVYAEVFGERSAPVADVAFRDFQRLILQGRLDEARTRSAALGDLFAEVYGAAHYRSVLLAAEQAWLEYLAGSPGAATALDPLLSQLAGLLDEESPLVAIHLIRRARMLAGDHAQFDTLLAQGDRRLGALPPDNPDRLNSAVTRAQGLMDRGAQGESRQIMEQVSGRLEQAPGLTVLRLRHMLLAHQLASGDRQKESRICQSAGAMLDEAARQDWDPRIGLGPDGERRFQNFSRACGKKN